MKGEVAVLLKSKISRITSIYIFLISSITLANEIIDDFIKSVVVQLFWQLSSAINKQKAISAPLASFNPTTMTHGF